MAGRIGGKECGGGRGGLGKCGVSMLVGWCVCVWATVVCACACVCLGTVVGLCGRADALCTRVRAPVVGGWRVDESAGHRRLVDDVVVVDDWGAGMRGAVCPVVLLHGVVELGRDAVGAVVVPAGDAGDAVDGMVWRVTGTGDIYVVRVTRIACCLDFEVYLM